MPACGVDAALKAALKTCSFSALAFCHHVTTGSSRGLHRIARSVADTHQVSAPLTGLVSRPSALLSLVRFVRFGRFGRFVLAVHVYLSRCHAQSLMRNRVHPLAH